MERPYDRTLRHLWKNELSKLNDHVPAKRIPLSTLLNMTKPSYLTRDGMDSAISQDELLNLANQIPEEFHSRIELPFVFLRRMDMGRGTYTLLGGLLDKFCLERLLGIEDACSTPWAHFKTVTPRRCYYTYHLIQFRKQFRSISTIVFTTMSSTPDENAPNREPWQDFRSNQKP